MTGALHEPRGWLLYDGACGFCSRWVPIWRGTLARVGLDVAPLQSPWVAERLGESETELLADLRILFADGTEARGADAYRWVMRRTWWAWPLWVLTCAPGLRSVFDRAYRTFATHRYHVSRACRLDERR